MYRKTYKLTLLLLTLLLSRSLYALEPNEILVLVNNDVPSSMELGRYFCQKRNVPKENILALPLGGTPVETISRDDYDKRIAEPVRKRLTEEISSGSDSPTIRCLLTTYGVPYKVGPRGVLEDQPGQLSRLQATVQEFEKTLADSKSQAKSPEEQARFNKELRKTREEIDRISGKETDAAVDSELSMVLFGSYELYHWQPNRMNKNRRVPEELTMTLMVCRLDGPTPQIAKGLVDKAIAAEKSALIGVAYIDSRGLADDKQPNSFAHFDQQVRDLAVLLRLRTNLEVKEERTEKLFEPGSCPRTAVYCGWYSLKKYVDAFDFVDGAIGYHIASLEAVDLRDANSSQWCPAMLSDGVTATIGAVAEPYLQSFPNPRDFFAELLDGKCLVEAFYRTQPFCSWQLLLIGDPLYRPFGK
jgi:uncharacterized protein (TIGR03790 family)